MFSKPEGVTEGVCAYKHVDTGRIPKRCCADGTSLLPRSKVSSGQGMIREGQDPSWCHARFEVFSDSRDHSDRRSIRVERLPRAADIGFCRASLGYPDDGLAPCHRASAAQDEVRADLAHSVMP